MANLSGFIEESGSLLQSLCSKTFVKAENVQPCSFLEAHSTPKTVQVSMSLSNPEDCANMHN